MMIIRTTIDPQETKARATTRGRKNKSTASRDMVVGYSTKMRHKDGPGIRISIVKGRESLAAKFVILGGKTIISATGTRGIKIREPLAHSLRKTRPCEDGPSCAWEGRQPRSRPRRLLHLRPMLQRERGLALAWGDVHACAWAEVQHPPSPRAFSVASTGVAR